MAIDQRTKSFSSTSTGLDSARNNESEQLPASENRLHFPALDGLRAVAALMVFVEHYVSSMPKPLRWGWAGVDIFFVLSGFLITGILLDTVDISHRFRIFYVRRTLRIFPLYYGVLLLLLLTTPLFHWEWNKYWLLWPLYLGNYAPAITSYYQGNMDLVHYLLPRSGAFMLSFLHFWTLSTEEQFYLFWPLVVYKVRNAKTIRNVCLAVIVLLPFIRIVARCTMPGMLVHDAALLYYATFFRLDGFLIGGMMAAMMRLPAGPRLREIGGRLLAVSVTCLVIAWVVAAKGLHQGFDISPNVAWVSTVGYTFLDLASAGLLLMALRTESVVYRVLTVKPLRRLGQVSYGFYVFHEIFLHCYHKLAIWMVHGRTAFVGPLTVVLGLVGTTSLAFLSFRFLERPFLKLKNSQLFGLNRGGEITR